MKKTLISMLLIVVMLFTLTACGTDNGANPEKPANSVETAGDEAAKDKENKPNYKATMVPYDELPAAKHIVFLQNALNFSREGFYNADNKPVTENIEYKGNTVAAYPISYALNFLTKGCTGEVTVTNNDGSTQKISAEDFSGLYVIVDFTSDAAPVLYNPKSGTEINDFLFATTEGGEAIYSVVSGSTHNTAEVIANVGWDTQQNYRFVATDKFHIPVKPEESANGEIRGTLSGAINASFPGMQIASGKLNDLILIQPIEE